MKTVAGPCDGIVWASERTTVTLSATCGHLGQVLADLDAVGLGVDRLELAANALGGFGLEVPHVDGGRAAGEPDQDDGLGLGALAPALRRPGPRARSSCGRVRPSRPAEPICRKSRRWKPSQSAFGTEHGSTSDGGRCVVNRLAWLLVVQDELACVDQAQTTSVKAAARSFVVGSVFLEGLELFAAWGSGSAWPGTAPRALRSSVLLRSFSSVATRLLGARSLLQQAGVGHAEERLRQGRLHGPFAVAGRRSRRPAEDAQGVRQARDCSAGSSRPRSCACRPGPSIAGSLPLTVSLARAEGGVEHVDHDLGHHRPDVAAGVS